MMTTQYLVAIALNLGSSHRTPPPYTEGRLLWVHGFSPSLDDVPPHEATVYTIIEADLAGGPLRQTPWATVRITGAVVPIPPAVLLFGSGLLGLIGFARCKKET